MHLFDCPARPEQYVRYVGDDHKFEDQANDVRREELSVEVEVAETDTVMHRQPE